MLSVLLFISSARAAEPFFKKNDVIALVGGEDMVVASEYGYLETLLTRALPDYHLRFRNLAWEGDTVYEQHRDLNFPSWEEQLDKIGATVVICQFGQMESLDGWEKIPAFIEAYGQLIDRLAAGGKRRIILFSPIRFVLTQPFRPRSDSEDILIQRLSGHSNDFYKYSEAIEKIATAHHAIFIDASSPAPDSDFLPQRDYCHLNDVGHYVFADLVQSGLERKAGLPHDITRDGVKTKRDAFRRAEAREELELPLRNLIRAKNKLWFDYWRVENWAFLFGDRTNQPSSRDWRDPSKRWFPAEREEFIPLIEAKEKEIDALAAKLGQK